MALINRVSMLNRCMSAAYKHTRTFSVTSQHHNADTIGFVGLGNMGAHMARNLIKTGHSILVYDLNTDITKLLKKEGASVAVTVAEVAAETKTIVSMLPSSPHVKEVYLGDNGIFSSVKSGSLLIDSSTIDPAVSRDVAIHAQQKGVSFFDAPVSGGVNAAREGTLTFMVGGPEKAFPQVEAILKHMGKNVVHCGNVGTGQAAKICNNMLLGISMIGTAETMNLGIKLGLDAKLLAKILNMSSGRCWSSELYNPCPGVLENVPSSNNYQGGFGTALMTKDLGLAQNAATMALSPTPLGSAAHQLYRIMCNSGYSAKDFSSAFLFLQELNKKE